MKTETPIAFTEFPKIARLSRECIITEKIDGTNGQICIGEDGEFLVGSRSRWSLFNVSRWCILSETPQRITMADPRIEKYQEAAPKCCHIVPVLYRGPFSTLQATDCLEVLRAIGSAAAPGFMKPEGIIMFHVAGNVGFKKTLEKDDAPKSFKS